MEIIFFYNFYKFAIRSERDPTDALFRIKYIWLEIFWLDKFQFAST